jgi:hypothetical protein
MRNSEEKIDWIKCLIRVDSAGRLDAFTEVMHAMSDDDYWEALSFVWQTSEIVTHDLDVWKILFSSSRSGRRKLMTDAEQKRLRSLPDRIKIFRGFNSQHWHPGMSWTLSKHVAYFFGHYCTSSRRAILFGVAGHFKMHHLWSLQSAPLLGGLI